MRSTLRSLTFGLAATLAGAALAQQPYTILVTGVISGCYPGQMVNIETNVGTQPYLNFDVPVNPNTCTWSATLNVASDPASFTASTQCNGMIVSSIGIAQFNFVMDSVALTVSMDCGGNPPVDCNGIENGPDMPGTPCDDGNPATTGDMWTPACVCAGADTSYIDCMGITNGPNLPGSTCTDFFGNLGIWSPSCICQTNTNPEDCLGTPGGGALPGTACTYTPDNGNTWVTGIWSVDCVCGPDSGNTDLDCLGNPGGTALPGTPCTAFGMVGTWDSNCDCVPNNPEPCEANFWVIQAMGSDSLPIPYELWVWNLSTGGNGNLAYSWNFGDGTSSNEAYPTHTYDGNGPYNLCLTIMDNNGCSDTFCDSVSINGDGIYEGMVVHAEDRQEGFTINVQEGQSTAVQEVVTSGNIATWPNPAVDELNIAVVSEMKGLVTVTITDLDGRTVKTERTSLGGGRSQLRIATSGLNAGMYLLRITDGSVNLSQRFVKTN
jgi:hypothetical protein